MTIFQISRNLKLYNNCINLTAGRWRDFQVQCIFGSFESMTLWQRPQGMYWSLYLMKTCGFHAFPSSGYTLAKTKGNNKFKIEVQCS